MNPLLMALSLALSAADATKLSEARPVQASTTVSSPRLLAVTTASGSRAQESRPRRHAILFFTASWCPACLQMKVETLPYVSLPGHELRMIDVDANPALCQGYGIQSLPAYVVLDSMGRAYRHGVGFRDVQQFVTFLNGR